VKEARAARSRDLGSFLRNEIPLIAGKVVGTMLEEIVQDKFSSIAAEGQPIFRTDVNYDALVAHRDKIVSQWRALGNEERAKFKSQAAYENEQGASDLRQADLIPARNLSLITREIRERMNSHNTLQLLPLETLEFDDSLLELAESLENVPEIRELYRLRKRTTGTLFSSYIEFSSLRKAVF
jgi:hypothetical protein